MTALLSRRRALQAAFLSLGLAACRRHDHEALHHLLVNDISPEIASRLGQIELNVATYKGAAASFFRLAGVEAPPYQVKYAEFGSGNLTFEALNSGAVDMGPMSEIPPVFGVGNHTQVRQIAVLTGDVNSHAVLVPRQSTISHIQQLAGKRIGYIRSTTSHYLLLRLLSELGLSWHDIQPIALSAQDGFMAFQTGHLDAWVTVGYYIPQAIARCGAHILTTGKGRLSGNFVVAAHAQAIADPVKHLAIMDYVLREYQVWRWIQQHPEAWADASAQLMGLPASIFMAQFKSQSQPRMLEPVSPSTIASQQQVADLFYRAGVLARPVDVRPLWDHSFRWS